MVEEAPAMGTALILVGERDEQVQELERFLLADANFAVDFASNGAEALELACSKRPTFVVTDLLVPGVDGLALCRRIKSDPNLRHASVLVLSHMSAELRAREAGADAFLRRPLTDHELVATVQSLLGPQATAE